MRRVLLLVALLCTHVPGATAVDYSSGDISSSTVLQRLLSSYGRSNVRPGLLYSPVQTDIVETQWGVDHLNNLDQYRQYWGLTGYLRMWWTDPRLSFSEAEAGTDRICMTPDEHKVIWKPNFYLEDAVSLEAKGGTENLCISSNGAVWYSRQRTIVMLCPLELSRQPYDTQTCKYMMGMYSELAHEVTMKWKDGRVALAGYDAACPSAWVPTALRQESLQQAYPSGNYSYAYGKSAQTRVN